MKNNTMKLLLANLSLRGKFSNVLYPGSDVLETWILEDIQELKVNVMTHTFDAMVFFGVVKSYDGGN